MGQHKLELIQAAAKWWRDCLVTENPGISEEQAERFRAALEMGIMGKEVDYLIVHRDFCWPSGTLIDALNDSNLSSYCLGCPTTMDLNAGIVETGNAEPVSFFEYQQAETAPFIEYNQFVKAWAFDDAPIAYQQLSTHGGDEDFVLYIPAGSSQELIEIGEQMADRLAVCDYYLYQGDHGYVWITTREEQ